MMKVKLKDGSIIELEKELSVLEIAKNISEGLARMANCRRNRWASGGFKNNY